MVLVLVGDGCGFDLGVVGGEVEGGEGLLFEGWLVDAGSLCFKCGGLRLLSINHVHLFSSIGSFIQYFSKPNISI